MNDETFESLPLDNRKRLLDELPASNGIYVFVKGNDIQYIGKSVNIKARVLSHIESAKLDAKEAAIVSNSDRIRFFITDNELKALILESKLIQKHKPPYNVRWRDDKSYLYIKVTVKDDYPKVFLSRRENDGKSRYFGPFLSSKIAQDIIKTTRRIIPFCTQKNVTKRACFYSKIGQCNPCPNVIENTKDPVVKEALKKQYKASIRKVIRFFEGKTDVLLKDLYKQMQEYSENLQYEDALNMRNKILRFENFLYGRAFVKDQEEIYNQSEERLKSLHKLMLHFFPEIQLPHRIECYDISNTNQQQITASMVVMNEGIIDKRDYRKFRIKDETVQSDFDAMLEVFQRRIKRHQWPKPTLIVVDGGRPQVRTVLGLFLKENYDIPLIGIAKNPDRLVIGNRELKTLRPPMNHPGFNLIRSLRDESHRFAKKYHVFLRTKKNFI